MLYFGKRIFRTLAHLELEACSEPLYIQNPGIFRTQSIFRTLSNIYLVHFLSSSSKNLEKSSKKSFCILRKLNFVALILRNLIILFLYFRKWKSWKISYIFSKESFSYISGKGNPKKFLMFQKVTFAAQKAKSPLWKNFLPFRKNFIKFYKIW